jgi:tetratricopeptide (TPR) repeat protein
MQEIVSSGKQLPGSYLIPSHYLNVIVRLYNQERQFGDVIAISKKVLEKDLFLSNEAEQEILYYLCLALARTKNPELTTYLPKIRDGITRQFIDGFSMRVNGRFDNAISTFLDILSQVSHQRARRELVNCYLLLEDYDKAYEYAKYNYEQQQWNPFHIQSYLYSLINGTGAKELINELLAKLKEIGNDVAMQMHFTMKAEYEVHEKLYLEARKTVDGGLARFPGSPYLQLLKIDNSLFDKNWLEAEHLLNSFSIRDKDSQFYNQFILRKALLAKGKKGISSGLAILSAELHRPNDVIRAKYNAKVQR